MKDWLIEHKFYLIVAVLILFGGIYYFYDDAAEDHTAVTSVTNDNKPQVEEEEKTEDKTQATLAQSDMVMVDVKGQVAQPGVYQSNTGERVIDVIGRAGGLTDQADQTQVNFAEHVVDEMVIYIPAKGEEGIIVPDAAGGDGTASGGASKQQGKININKADVQELQNLPGVGPAKAEAIIEYRNTSGPFKTIEDLKNISGIGEKTFEKLQEMIAVN
ncbi:helix-hairpin-helix domain-containing protein [Neobacillus jeddahensis]|uniref:helix-hairpin-helix domain-containing protein n=1 Tax=Neobacillus jeddahensis TaxID=1461580 RepID=UPI00058AFD53|nr:helix-hairpin-helix domain-containing protein [Neobacillus jeddahensis]